MLGSRIRALRVSKGLTQQQFASQIRISQNHLSQIELNKKSPSLELFCSIARELNVTPSELAGESLRPGSFFSMRGMSGTSWIIAPESGNPILVNENEVLKAIGDGKSFREILVDRELREGFCKIARSDDGITWLLIISGKFRLSLDEKSRRWEVFERDQYGEWKVLDCDPNPQEPVRGG